VILTVDIGNSRIKWGLWQDSFIVESAAHEYEIVDLAQVLSRAWRAIDKPEVVMLSCVAGNTVENAVCSWLHEHWQLEARVLHTTGRFGDLTHGYPHPEQHGADRWAAMIAARGMYKSALCVISCGTAVTLDLIDASGKHLGGRILPGVDLVFKSLGQRLPVLSNQQTGSTDDIPVFATNTADAVASGVLHMLAAALDQACDDARKIVGDDMKTLLTGGGAPAMLALMRSPLEFQPDLVLRGLFIKSQAVQA
jgi:type III pantothenate kinase